MGLLNNYNPQKEEAKRLHRGVRRAGRLQWCPGHERSPGERRPCDVPLYRLLQRLIPPELTQSRYGLDH